MREVILFCEDSFHEKFVGSLLRRFEGHYGVPVNPRFLSAQGGVPQMHGEFKQFLRDLANDRTSLPDSIIAVRDANCRSYNEAKQTLEDVVRSYPQFQPLVSYAIPDPHIEPWMLADAKAFQSVFGRGCTVPAIKCQKNEYKKLLRKEISDCGIDPALGGLEFAEDIVQKMDLGQMERRERSLGSFLKDLKALFNRWSSR